MIFAEQACAHGVRAFRNTYFRARCFFAAFMLSTRLGYLRPAFFALRRAAALLAAVSLVWREFRGGAFSQGSLLEDFRVAISLRTPPKALLALSSRDGKKNPTQLSLRAHVPISA